MSVFFAFIRKLIFASFVISAFGCKAKEEQQGAKSPDIPVPVFASPAEQKSSTATEEVVGTVQSKLRATISAKISGRIEKVLIAAGQSVKQGQLLIELEAGDLKAKVDQSAALFNQATTDLARTKNLFSGNAATKQDYDTAISRERVARAGLTEARTMLSYSRITAPFDGTITQKFVNVGDLAAPGIPLLEIFSPGLLRFEAEIPESMIGFVSMNNQLAISTRNTGIIHGTVSEIAPMADPRSRTFLIKLDLPDSVKLLPGQFGRLNVPIGRITSIYIPASAVLIKGQMELVYVVQNGKANMRLVRTGQTRDDEVQILSGLAPGELVATSGFNSLQDQRSVTIQQSKDR